MPPDPESIGAVATELGVDPSFVEKDWHAIRLVATVAGVREGDLELVFSGGTSLSKGYGLIRRFSEDLDFRVLLPEAGVQRSARRRYRSAVIEAIRAGDDWTLPDEGVEAGNESRFFRCHVGYPTTTAVAPILRSELRLEVTFSRPALAPEHRSLRSFVAEARRLAVVSHRFWQVRFGGSLDALGASVELDGRPSTIVGVLPDGFRFGSLDADVFEPHTLFPDWEARRLVRGRDSWFVVGRLRPGVAVEEAQAEMSTIAGRLDAEMPAAERNRGVRVVPLTRHVVGARSRLAMWMLMAAVGCVVLIAAVNVANLWLARSLGRGREVALRAALGAGPGRIVRQHLTESTTLALGAGVVGTLLAVVGLDLVRALGSVEAVAVARLGEVRLDAGALGWSLVLSLLMGVAVGLAPALLWRRHLRGFGGADGRAAAGGVAARTVRRALLVAEVALAVVLLVGGGLLVRSWWQVEGVDPGFRPERVLAMQIGAPALMAPAQRADFYRRALERIEALPGVERAGFISDAFIGGSPERTLTTEREGEAVSARLQYRSDEVSEGLFQAFGTRLRGGRFFSLREVGPLDPETFIGGLALLLLVALAACGVPGRRAMKVAPIVALRED